MPTIDPAIAEALGKMAAEDPAAANLAGTALTWVTAGGGAGRITQERVQRFVWYDMPIKLRPTADGRRAITQALATVLDLLDLPRYAQICRSDVTAEVHAAYDAGPQPGLQAFRRANLASGIYPPDLEEFAWGAAMGMEEARALAGVQDYLELAVASGELQPGTRGFTRRQKALVRRWLSTPNFQLGGQTPLDVMNTERIQNWIGVEPSDARHRLVAALANRLLHPAELPEDVEDPYPPLTALLRELADGGAVDTDPALVDVARGLRLVRRLRGSLVVTRRGRRALEEPRGVWRDFPAYLLRGNPYQRLAGEVLLALLIDSPTDRATLISTLQRIATEANYREAGTGAPPGPESLDRALEPTVAPLRALAMLTGAERLELTPVGRSVALEALRRRATGPATAPWQ